MPASHLRRCAETREYIFFCLIHLPRRCNISFVASGERTRDCRTPPRFHALRLNSFLSYLFVSVLLLTLPVSNFYRERLQKEISCVQVYFFIILNIVFINSHHKSSAININFVIPSKMMILIIIRKNVMRFEYCFPLLKGYT